VQPLISMDGTQLAKAFLGGVIELTNKAAHLDRINVFPVADGDTGTNLAMTLQSLNPTLQVRSEHAGQLLVKLADAALDGARGNSGAIFAQFLCGMSDHAANFSVLSVSQMTEAWAYGARAARLAVSHPQPGTMLSIFEGLSQYFGHENRQTNCLRTLWQNAVQEATRLVDATRSTLEPMRKANVVDAGALGVLAFVEGMTHTLTTGQLPMGGVMPTQTQTSALAHDLGDERYCTECLIEGSSIDQRGVRENLAAFGSSLVVAGSAHKVRLHIHTNDPAAVFREMARFGRLTESKADDMQRQTLSARRQEAQVAIVMDSAGDLPEELISQYHIHVVPLRVHFGEESFIDKVGLSQDEFFDKLNSSELAPKTSQPAIGDFRRCFEYLSSHHPGVVAITVTAKASGTYQSAMSAITRLAANSCVSVIDSLNASVGQGLLALTAAEAATTGADVNRILQAVERIRPLTRTWAFLPTLTHAVKGGRVPPIAQLLSRWLRATLLLTAHGNGRIGFGGVVWGKADRLKAFARVIVGKLDPQQDYRLLIGHGAALADAERLAEYIQSQRPRCQLVGITPTGAALAVHGGPGFLVVSAQSVLNPQDNFARG